MMRHLSQGLLLLLLVATVSPAHGAGITFLGAGTVPGNASDLSGLTGSYGSNGDMPKDRLGSFGSGIAYTGVGNRYVMVGDRGYADGTVDYNDRMQYFDIKVQLNPGNPNQATVTPTLVDTKLLYNQAGVNFTGFSGAFNPSTYPAGGLRLDPEAIRVGYDGKIYASDEYGPYINVFDKDGNQVGSIAIPAKFSIANPSASANDELANNAMGRQTNRGMEGLAISPDGRYLFGMMQNALIQDHGLNASLGRVGINNLILKVDLQTGETSEYVYQLDKIGQGQGTNEIVAVNDHEFLVIERDNLTNSSAVKDVYKIDLTGATDVSAYGTTASNGLPAGALPPGVVPASKELFMDVTSYLNAAGLPIPEKFEGLSFGPDLEDGRRLLLVTTDNDLMANNPTYIYAFAIDRDLLPGYTAQAFVPEPSSWAMIATGVAALAVTRRRRPARNAA